MSDQYLLRKVTDSTAWSRFEFNCHCELALLGPGDLEWSHQVETGQKPPQKIQRGRFYCLFERFRPASERTGKLDFTQGGNVFTALTFLLGFFSGDWTFF